MTNMHIRVYYVNKNTHSEWKETTKRISQMQFNTKANKGSNLTSLDL